MENKRDGLLLRLQIQERIYYYSESYGHNKELDLLIATDNQWAYMYLLNIVKGRFKLAEYTFSLYESFIRAYKNFTGIQL